MKQSDALTETDVANELTASHPGNLEGVNVEIKSVPTDGDGHQKWNVTVADDSESQAVDAALQNSDVLFRGDDWTFQTTCRYGTAVKTYAK